MRFKDSAQDARPRLLVLMLGLTADEIAPLVDSVVGRARNQGREPIFVVSVPCFEHLRRHEVVVEMVPSAEILGESDPVRYQVFASERLESIRETWLTTFELDLSRSGSVPEAPVKSD